eukprot:6191930-Pleurochrysis_carterae.AAC.3
MALRHSTRLGIFAPFDGSVCSARIPLFCSPFPPSRLRSLTALQPTARGCSPACFVVPSGALYQFPSDVQIHCG